MKHVGTAVYLKPNSKWWSGECGMYLLANYPSREGRFEIANYQMNWRFYKDEVGKWGEDETEESERVA